jgi:hypothetical protein
MLFDSGLPKTFWGYAYLAATHIRNRIPTVERESTTGSTPVTPYELWFNIKPNIPNIQGLVYKARLIAHGFKQTPGSDYWETFAPVSSSISTRIYLTMCATFGMTIHQMDIDTAF